MYRLTEWGQSRLPLPYVPWRDMSDEEFAQHGRPLLVERGYFEHVPEKGAKADDDAADTSEVIGGRSARKKEGDR